MKIKQLSVFCENKPGHVIAPCRLLADSGIDIRALLDGAAAMDEATRRHIEAKALKQPAEKQAKASFSSSSASSGR